LHDALVNFSLCNPNQRQKIISFIRDGCSTNTAAIKTLSKIGFRHCIDLKCISHASSNIGKELYGSCKLGVDFIGKFNKMLNYSHNARSIYSELIQSSVNRYSGDVRWFYQQELSSQMFANWQHVLSVIYHQDNFTPSIRSDLKSMLNENMNDIKLELSLLEDCAVPIAKLCYEQEGDGLLSPTSYDHWHSVISLLHGYVENRIELPCVMNTLMELYPSPLDHDIRQEKILVIKQKIIPCWMYMTEITNSPTKLLPTLCTLRACRLLDYRFIAKHPMNSICEVDELQNISGEITQLLQLPMFDNLEQNILPYVHELELYYNISREEVTIDEVDLLSFWKKNVITLPNFSKLVRHLGCLTPSSATVERLFSMLKSFNYSQCNALADYVKTRCMIRYNEIFRYRYDEED